MDNSLPNRNSYLTTQIENDQLTDFKYILSHQHSKQFHLIDSPDLVFQLAQYKFDRGQSSKPKNKSPKFFNKKVYRHKSQQESIETQFLSKNLHFQNQSSSNVPYQKFKQARSAFDEDPHDLKLYTVNSQTKKIQFDTKEKSFTSKGKTKQSSLKIDFKNFHEKENLDAKISSVARPMTSNITNIKNLSSKQSDTKSSWKKVFQRKKYSDLKGKLEALIKNIQNCEDFNFSEVFEYEQAILKDYLASLVTELKKECVEKGELIQMIWNTFFTLISKIMKILVENKKITQKNQLQQQINLHQGYQDMYLYEANKIIELGKKYNESKNVIDRLVYELRYKRKETKKLHKSLAICNQKLNQYKIQHIDLQNEHIDLLIESKQMEKDQAAQILKRKLEVNKEKCMRLRVGMNKEKMKQKIESQILSEQIDPEEEETFKKEFFQKIHSFKYKKKMSPIQQKQQSRFVQEFIQRYSNKFIQQNYSGKDIQIRKTMRRPQKTSTAINTDIDPKGRNELASSIIQTTFSDKMQFCLINNHSTQTTAFQKIKKCVNVEVQADGDQMKIVLTKAKMMAYKTMDLSFFFDLKRRDQKVKQKISRKSQFSNQKEFKLNKSISQISSDGSDETPKISSKKKLSKYEQTPKKNKKMSIFNNTSPNYSTIRTNNNRNSKGKYEFSSNMQKKRASQIPQIFQSGGQSEFKRQRNLPKKRTLLSPSSFQRNFNRPSICLSNVDSLIESILITEEKQKYIENYIMSKEQQFQVVQQNAIFEAFKDYLGQQNKKKSGFFQNQKDKQTAYKKIIEVKNQDVQDEQNLNNEFLNPKESYSSLQKLKETHKQFQRSIKKAHGKSRSSINRIKDNTELKAEKASLKKAHFLNNFIEFTVKKSLIKKKMDPSNFQVCKEKSEFKSITQKLDPIMLDVQFLVSQGLIKKRKPNSINIKAANKFLIMTYSRSIDKIYRSNAILQNLIKPLFESFQVIYGALKPNEIYRKMVGFISDILSMNGNQYFKEFIFFLGMDKNNIYSGYLTTFDVCLYLKLLERLNIGGKISSEIENVFTSKSKVTTELVNVLDSENISPEVIMIVSGKIKVLLDKLQDFVRESKQSTEEESKINLFKVSKMIVEEIIKLRVQSMKKLEMYLTGSQLYIQTSIKDIQRTKNDLIKVCPIQKIVQCCRISTSKKLYFSKCIQELCSKDEINQLNEKIIKRSELGVLLIRIGLVNFDDLQDRIKYIELNNKRMTLDKKEEIQLAVKEIQLNNFSRNLEKLTIIQTSTNVILENILGDMIIAYEIGLIKSLESKKDKAK